jgi:hypothetical protein
MAASQQSERPSSERNLAAYMFVVGAITIVFWATFVFGFSGVVLQLFLVTAAGVALFSVTVGVVLDMLGYFDDDVADSTVGGNYSGATSQNGTLPPLLDFDEELVALESSLDDDGSARLSTVAVEYGRLKGDPANRHEVAHSMRSALATLSVGTEGPTKAEPEAIVDDMGDRLSEYIETEPAD